MSLANLLAVSTYSLDLTDLDSIDTEPVDPLAGLQLCFDFMRRCDEQRDEAWLAIDEDNS